MFKKISLFVLILLTALAISCKKEETQQTTVTEEAPIFDEFIEFVLPQNWETGYVLRVGAGLYTMDEDTGSDSDIIKWAASLNLGDRIMIGEPRKATFQDNAGNKTLYDVYPVRDSGGREGYALAVQVAVGGTLAVVTDERTNLYRTASAVNATGSLLSRRTVFVYYPESETDGFVQIRAYDPEARANRHDQYIRSNTFSTKQADIESVILLHTALSLRETVASEKARRDVLLELAMLDYPDSVFYFEIHDIINPPQINIHPSQPVIQYDDEE